MKQFLLAVFLIAIPVGAFAGFQVYARHTLVASVDLGDLSSFETIITDVQAFAAKGDLAGAAKRITDYETAWDNGETAIRPLNQTEWGNIDAASDAALKAVRAPQPSLEKVQTALASLMAALRDPGKTAQ